MADPWQDPAEELDRAPEAPVDLKELELGNPLKKVRFQFRHQDQDILDRIQTEADEMFADMFPEAIEQMNAFYSAIRTPKVDRNGMTQKNGRGEIVWEDHEDMNQLTGQDLELIYMNLEKIKIFLTPVVHRLKLEAMWAQIAATDAKDEVRTRIHPEMKMATDDKAAKANKDSREDRYLAFFKYYLWSTADVFYDQIVDFMWKLRDVRNWRIQSQV